MFRKPLIALAATVSLFALPAAAQETPASAAAGEAAMAAMAGAFKVDPLTAEQQARLPLAQTIVGKIMPPGTMNEVMGAMSQSILGPLAALASTPTPGDAVRMLGADPDSVVLDDVTAKEVIGIIDPAWKDRREQSVAVTQETMTKVMGAMEPVIRKAMAEIYAVHFSTPELTDIDAREKCRLDGAENAAVAEHEEILPLGNDAGNVRHSLFPLPDAGGLAVFDAHGGAALGGAALAYGAEEYAVGIAR